MKDYLAYTLMGRMGVAAPLCSFAEIRVNGEAWGVYLAVEAVHNFLVNDDSYTGNMIHNYYLYEEDGRLSMIPWDYIPSTTEGQRADSSALIDASHVSLDDLGEFGMGGFGGVRSCAAGSADLRAILQIRAINSKNALSRGHRSPESAFFI